MYLDHFGGIPTPALSELGELRERIHRKFQSHEDAVGIHSTPERNAFYGATDALLDTHDALISLRRGFPKGTGSAKLAMYGFLQSLFIQQDAVVMIDAIVNRGSIKQQRKKLHEDPVIGPLRILRNRVAGHPVFAENAGGTAAIPVSVAGFYLHVAIYGLPEVSPENKSPRFHIGELINSNADGLLTMLRSADEVLDNPQIIFARILERTSLQAAHDLKNAST